LEIQMNIATKLSAVVLATAIAATSLPASAVSTVPGYRGPGLSDESVPLGEPFMPFGKPIFVERPNVLTLEPIKLACAFIAHGEGIVLTFVNEGGPIPPGSEIHSLYPGQDIWMNSIKLPEGLDRGETLTIVLSDEFWGQFAGQICNTEVELA
jgi:hypothetical protein